MKFFQRLINDVALIEFGELEAMVSTVRQIQAAEHPILKQLKDKVKPSMTVNRDGTAIVPVEGALAHKPDFFEMAFMGIEDSRNVLEMLSAAASNPDVAGVLLDVDSPGGMVLGGVEIADAVRSLNAKKPVVAWSGGLAASLAYLIASQASQVVTTRSSLSGSVGVKTAHVDYTQMLERMGIKIEVFTNKEGTLKAAGDMGTALTDAQRADIQDRVQKVFGEMKKQITSARPGIAEEAMKGQVLYGSEAKKVGLVDRLGDRDFALSVLRQEMRKRLP